MPLPVHIMQSFELLEPNSTLNKMFPEHVWLPSLSLSICGYLVTSWKVRLKNEELSWERVWLRNGEKTEQGRTRSDVDLKKDPENFLFDWTEVEEWGYFGGFEYISIHVQTCSFTVITCVCVIEVSGAVLYNFLRFSEVVATKYLLNSYK